MMKKRNPNSQTKAKELIRITTFLTLFLLCISFASAVQWAQYSGTPTTSSISRIRTSGNTAMALTNADQVLNYNGSLWQEVVKPVDVPTPLIAVNFDVNEANEFVWGFGSVSAYKIYKFNPVTKTWSSFIETGSWGGWEMTLMCTKESGGSSVNGCWIARQSNTGDLIGVAGTSGTIPQTGIVGLLDNILGTRNPYLVSYNGLSQYYNYFFNGASWISIGANSPIRMIDEYDQNYRYAYVAGAPSFAYTWNQTTNSFQGRCTSNCFKGYYFRDPETLGMWGTSYASNNYIAYTSDYFDSDVSLDAYKGAYDVTAGHIDEQSLTGWLGLANGNLFQYTPLGGGGGGNQYFTIVTTPSSNPTLYGSTFTLTQLGTNTYGGTATITWDYYNSTGSSVYGGTCQIIGTGGGTCEEVISGNSWQYFQAGQTYTVVSEIDDGIHYDNTSFSWSVTGNATQNETERTVTTYLGNEDYTQLYAVARINNNRLFGVGNDLYGHYVLSYDITSPSNIIVKSKLVNETTNSFFEPTSIATNGDNVYLGTDDRLFAFTNASYQDATKLAQDANAYAFPVSFYDRVNDLEATSTGSWICHQGAIYDEAVFFNRTNADLGTDLSADPCLGIILKDDALFVRLDTSIKIYNTTTQNLIATITGLTAPSGGARHDLMSISGNTLYTLSGINNVRKYNIANIASPSYVTKCYTNYETLSLEALYDDIVVVGTQPSGLAYTLRVCDFADQTLYDSGSQVYSSVTIKTLQNNEEPTDIIKMTDAGKFVVAMQSKIGVFFYSQEIVEEQLPQPPSIGSITTDTNTPCVNQTIQATIEATDPDTATNMLTYDYDCTGVKPNKVNSYTTNLFQCNYASSGSKTIKAFVSDGNSIVSSTKSISVQTCNTSQQNYLNFKVLDYDTGALLGGVLVAVSGQTSKTTNTAGQASFQLNSAGTYSVAFSKSGYIGVTNNYATYNGVYTLYLRNTIPPNGTTQRNQLYVTVVDKNALPIPNALVSVTNPITAISKTEQTDNTGLASFLDLASGVQLRVSSSKSGYDAVFTNTQVGIGEIKALTITLYLKGQNQNQIGSRGCSDYIDGLVLCSPLNISGTGDSCNQDSDCITGRCELSPSRQCAKFNWTWCDDNGYERGNKCFASAMSSKSGENTSDWILDNFLYVLAFIAVAIFVMMIIKSVKGN